MATAMWTVVQASIITNNYTAQATG